MRKDTTTVLVGLAVVVVTAVSPIVLGKGGLPWSPARQETISGLVSCRLGRAVVGVWVAEVTNVGMFADWNPKAGYPSMAEYHATVPAGIEYELHIGCGGSARDWSMSASSSKTTAVSLTLHCDDVKGGPTYGTCS